MFFLPLPLELTGVTDDTLYEKKETTIFCSISCCQQLTLLDCLRKDRYM